MKAGPNAEHPLSPPGIEVASDRPRAGLGRGLLLGAWYGLLVLILVSMIGNSVNQVMLLVTEPMKQELLLSDAQIGALRGIGVSMVVAIATYPIGWLADRVDRRAIIAICIVIWSLSTAALGLSTSYAMMFGCAMGIAVGEAVLGPVVFSIIPDLFPPERRMIANSIFFIAQLLGYAAGLSIGGAMIGAIESSHAALPDFLQGMATWRVAFFAVALPGLVIAPLVLGIPVRRTRRSAAVVRETGVGAHFRRHGRTLFPLFIGFGAIGAANFTVFGWLAVAIVRMFGETPATVGMHLGQVFAFGSVAGVVFANLLARLLRRRNADFAPLRVAQIGAAAALLLSSLYLFAETPQQFYILASFQIAASFGGLALSPTITQNVAPARIRARLIAIGGLFYIIFGALSPLVVGAVSDALGPEPRNLLRAMLVVGLPAFAAGIVLLRASEPTLRSTLDAARDGA